MFRHYNILLFEVILLLWLRWAPPNGGYPLYNKLKNELVILSATALSDTNRRRISSAGKKGSGVSAALSQVERSIKYGRKEKR